MRVTITDESFTPSPQDMANEFWDSDAERQAEILYALALIYKHDLCSFCIQMFNVSNELDKDAREDILSCLKEMINQMEGNYFVR